MTRAQFGPEHVARVATLVETALRTGELSAPRAREGERSFTARALQPLVADLIASLGIAGLVHAGDGVAPVKPVSFLGRPFYPDITVAHHERQLLACEVKYLKGSHRQNAVATALGQASLYQAAGYERAMLIMLDLGRPQVTDRHVRAADDLLHSTHRLHLVIRRLGKRGFAPHANTY